jgi:hypothetical protein
MVTLDGCLMEKYRAGLIAREEVVTKAYDPTTILQKLQEYELDMGHNAEAEEEEAEEGEEQKGEEQKGDEH